MECGDDELTYLGWLFVYCFVDLGRNGELRSYQGAGQ